MTKKKCIKMKKTEKKNCQAVEARWLIISFDGFEKLFLKVHDNLQKTPRRPIYLNASYFRRDKNEIKI